MADSKITALTAISTVDPTADPLVIVDVSDTSMAASGTTKKSTINQLLGAGGTATLASATITGAATVGTTLGVTGVSTFAAGTALLPALTTTGDTNTGIYYPAADTFAVTTAGAERYRVDSAGNCGIGVTPSAWDSGFQVIENSGGSLWSGSTGAVRLSQNTYYATSLKYKNALAASQYVQTSGQHQWFTAASGTAGTTITDFATAKMTLDASGNLNLGVTSSLINTTRRLSVSGTVAAALQSTGAATVETINVWHTATSGNNVFVDFDTEAAVTSRGSISYNRGGGLVAYNTTSDYRAKDIIGPVSNSGLLIDSLKVYVGKMKGATIERPMLIAHEAQEVAPYAVTGTKDEVDADGNPKYQQMDASALVPLLIAEIQSLRARVQTLETR
jgi:hypothetical protein